MTLLANSFFPSCNQKSSKLATDGSPFCSLLGFFFVIDWAQFLTSYFCQVVSQKSFDQVGVGVSSSLKLWIKLSSLRVWGKKKYCRFSADCEMCLSIAWNTKRGIKDFVFIFVCIYIYIYNLAIKFIVVLNYKISCNFITIFFY